MKWYLIPGLGADYRMFANMVDLLDDYEILEHAVPEPQETIEQYATRLGAGIDRRKPIVLAGVSFGGMLGAILSEAVQPRAVVLMSSTHRPEALSGAMRSYEWLSRVFSDTLAKWVHRIGCDGTHLLEPLDPSSAALFQDMTAKAPVQLLRRAGRMIMDWRRPPELPCPRYHLHGARDLVIPSRGILPAQIIPGAGHLLNLTHPTEVRTFIADVLRKL